MAFPDRDPSTTCESCELRSIDFTEWSNGINVPSAAQYMVTQVVVKGEDIRRAPTVAYDPDSGFDVPSSALAATRDCVARILAGDCTKYTAGAKGELVEKYNAGVSPDQS